MVAPRALITGITGMVGSHLAEFLLERTDWDIIGMCRWRSPLDNLANIAWRINAGDRCLAALWRPARHHVDPERRGQGQARLRLPSRRPELSAHQLRRAARHHGHQRPGHGARARRAEAACAQGDHPCLRLVRGVRPGAQGEAADRRGMHVPSGLALRHLQGRHRSGRPLLCRGLRHDGDDDAHVHPYRAAARRRLRRIDLRQADRDDRAQSDPARGQGRQPAIAAHRRRRARRRARLLHAGHRQSDRRAPTTISAARIPARSKRHPRHADLLLAAARTTSGSRSIPIACGRSMPICRCPTPPSSRRTPAGSPRSPTRRPCATCWTTGAIAWQRKATAS